jgi:dihydroflavonol-4-reductase
LAAARGQPGRRYILGNAQGNLALDDFVALMERVSGVPQPRNAPTGKPPAWRTLASRVRRVLAPRQPAQPGFRPAALTADPSRAICELGLPQTPLEVAFREAVAWYRAHGYVGS